MVVGVLGAFAAIAKVRYSSTAVDSHVFRLHYRWTATLCFACCALVVAKEYIGSAIMCMGDGASKATIKAATTYCWITSTFTINSTGSILPGLGHYDSDIHEQSFHSYYQWVPLVLFMQGCMFYLPHFFWKCYEGKQVDRLLQDLNKGLFDEDSEKKKKNIVSYLKQSWGLNVHYVTIYHLCEIVNFVSVLLQMYLMDMFLGGIFWDYGTKVFSLLKAEDTVSQNALATIFPKVTKCTFKKFGPGGGIKNEDVLCVLPQNIVNEKIFLVMWLWFVILAAITGAWLIWRLTVILSLPVRRRLLEHLTRCRVSIATEQAIRALHLGDFCLLEHLGYNLDALAFRDVLQGVTDSLEEYDPTAPIIDDGTYRTYSKPDEDMDMLPRHRYNADTSL